MQFDNNVLINGQRYALHLTYQGMDTTFKYTTTRRRFVRPELAAAVIGILIQYNMDVISYGFSFSDSTCFPSQTHNNGEALDTAYKARNVDEQRLIDLMREWGFTYILKGEDDRFASLTGAIPFPHHNSHLHTGSFTINL